MTHAAATDLRLLYNYLADHGSPAIADKWARLIRDRIGALRHFPLRGPVPPELGSDDPPGCRQQLVGPYRLIYEVDGSRVRVFLVADGRRDLGALLRRRLDQ